MTFGSGWDTCGGGQPGFWTVMLNEPRPNFGFRLIRWRCKLSYIFR